MAPPTPPSDSTRLNKVDASSHPEHGTNLLDLMSDVKKNALAPAFNSFAVEPINVAGNIINFTTDVVTSGVNKLTGANHKALQVGKVTEMEVGKAEQNSVASWSQQLFGTAGSFLAYATAGKIAGRVMRTGGELLPVELEYQNIKIGVAARALAQDTRVANVLGATTYAGLKDPHEGESRLSNAASTLVGFSFFEAGNTHFVNPASSAMFKLGQRYTVGSLGGIAQVNVASIIQHGQFADASSTAASGLSGGVLNVLLPGGRRIADAAVENRIIKSIPHVTDATARLYSDAVKSLPPGRAPEPGSWADPKAVKAVNDLAVHDLDTRLTVDHGVTDAHGSKVKSGDDKDISRSTENAHESAGDNRTDDENAGRRKRGKKSRRANDVVANSEDDSPSRKTKKVGSETQDVANGVDVVPSTQTPGEQPRNWIDQKANVIHHGSKNEPLDVVEELAHRKIFKEPEYEQQFQSHAQEIVSRNPADPRNEAVKEKYIVTRLNQEIAARVTENEEAAKLGLPIRVAVDRDVIRYKEGYGARFEQEANLFVSSGGKTRPEIDFSGGSAARLNYAYIEEPAPIVPAGHKPVSGSDEIKVVSVTPPEAERHSNSGTADGAMSKPAELVIVGGTDSPAAREAARVARTERIANWERVSNQIIRSSVDPKDRPQNSLFSVVRDKVNSTGLARDGWVVLPTETGSPLDQVGCDYALVNVRKNQAIFLDATQNQAKIQNPGAHNVSNLRAPGVIGFESRWLDMMDKLKIDDDGAVGHDARQFDTQLDHQLKALVNAGSPITIDMMPSAMRQGDPRLTQEQVDKFRGALLKRSVEYSVGSRDRQDLESYAHDLQYGASKYNEFQVATKPSPVLTEAMQRQSDKVVLDYVLNKLHIKGAPEAPKVDSKSVRLGKDGHLVITVDNTIYDGGDVKESLTESRRALRAEPARLEMLLQRDKSVLNKMRTDNLTMPQVMRMVQEGLVSAREIDNGMLGTRNIGLDETLRGRIVQQNLEDAVAGRTPKLVEKAVEAAPKSVRIKSAGFTSEQQIEIPKMARVMSDFGLKVQDGVDPNDLKAFVEMYAENANSQSVRELATTYAAEVDKPISQQRLIPRLHGALVAAQMRVEYQPGSTDNQTLSGSPEAVAPSGEGAKRIAQNEKALIAETAQLPFEQVRLALQRLNELQSNKELGPEEQFQLEALQAFKAHMLEPDVRAAIAKNLKALSSVGAPAAIALLSTMAIQQWYQVKVNQKQRDDKGNI